jgi:hypothetical protein
MLFSLVIQTGCDRAERRLSVFGRPDRYPDGVTVQEPPVPAESLMRRERP